MPDTSRLPMPTQETYEWQYRGACADADPATFYPPEDERGIRRRRREAVAKEFCATCPVVAECLNHALSAGEPYGVWGGLNPAEREKLGRRDAG